MSAGTQIAPTPVAPVVPRTRTRRPRLRKLGWNLLGLLVFFVMVFPVYWMVATAFKPGQQILSYTPQWFPTHPTLTNFRDAIDQPFFWDAVRNSLIIVTAVVALSRGAGLPGVARAREVPLLRTQGVHRAHPRRADGAAERADHPALHPHVTPGPGRQAHRGDRDVPDVRPAVHGLDDARLPARHPEGARGGGDGRRGYAASARSSASCCRSSGPAWSRPRSSPSSRPGTSSSSRTCSCTAPRSRR